MVSYEDLGNLGTLASQSGFQSAYGQNKAQAGAQYAQRQGADTQMLMGNAFQRQNMNLQNQYNTQARGDQMAFDAAQGNAQRQFQGEQNAAQRGIEQQGLNLRAQDQNFDNRMEAGRLQSTYDMANARSAEAATNDARDFRNKVLFEDLKHQYGEQEAVTKMREKLRYEASLDTQKHEAARNNFAQAAVSSGQVASLDEGGLMFDRNLVDTAAVKARGGKGAGGSGDPLLGTYSGDITQGAILALKSGKGAQFIDSLQGKGSGRELPYNQGVAASAMYAAASNPAETSDDQVFRAIAEAQASGNHDLAASLQQAYRDRVAFGSNQRSNSRSGGPGPGMGGGVAPPSGYGAQKPPEKMSDEELLMQIYGPQR